MMVSVWVAAIGVTYCRVSEVGHMHVVVIIILSLTLCWGVAL